MIKMINQIYNHNKNFWMKQDKHWLQWSKLTLLMIYRCMIKKSPNNWKIYSMLIKIVKKKKGKVLLFNMKNNAINWVKRRKKLKIWMKYLIKMKNNHRIWLTYSLISKRRKKNKNHNNLLNNQAIVKKK